MVAHRAVEYTALEYTMDAVKHSEYGCTKTMVEKTVVVAQTTVVVSFVVQTADVVVPPAVVAVVAVSPLVVVLLPSYSTYPLSFLGLGRMLGNPSFLKFSDFRLLCHALVEFLALKLLVDSPSLEV